ncbi:MAG: translation initiation factor IF-3 [Patescibacteria group bacterium]
MRISRKKRPEKPLTVGYKKNSEITSEKVLLLDNDGNNLGEMPTRDALRLAEEKEFDLVEINPKSDPPVAKLIIFSEFKYQKEKEARKQKAHSHVSEIKGVRLSVRISDHDLGVKKEQAERFLDRGDKVKIELILRGREHGKMDIAYEIIGRFIGLIGATMPIRQEQEIQKQDHKMTAIIAKK